MGVDDLARVLDVEKRAYPFPWTEGIFRDCLRVGYSAWLVEDADGELLAYALMSMAAGEAHILNLCVEPARQREGLGRFLLDHLMRIARAAHVNLVLLEVRRSNRGARRLYESAGYRTLGVRKGYYPSAEGREDALVLGYELA